MSGINWEVTSWLKSTDLLLCNTYLLPKESTDPVYSAGAGLLARPLLGYSVPQFCAFTVAGSARAKFQPFNILIVVEHSI